MSQSKRVVNVNKFNPKVRVLWQSIIEIIRHSPAQAASVELESHAYLLLTILDHEISSSTIAVIYGSAVEGENLEWLMDRLDHEKSKAS
ncbi:MAG: hypothetical protein K2X47_12220 [Bdellovibrionales bacterium]|nr:hypothetical protein [Bdellovibrionales bacterium]